jgi:hypothetical protein
MEKVKISQELANHIETIRDIRKTNLETLSFILHSAIENNLEVEKEISLVDIARAIEEGYEIIREFQVGDIVWGYIMNRVYVVHEEKDGDGYLPLYYVKSNPKDFKLVCKAENREDKQNDK